MHHYQYDNFHESHLTPYTQAQSPTWAYIYLIKNKSLHTTAGQIVSRPGTIGLCCIKELRHAWTGGH